MAGDGSPATRGVGQATSSERLERPIQKPSIAWVGRVLRLAGGAERHEERGEVLDGRVCVRHPGCAGLERGELVDVASRERFGSPRVEVDRPRRRRRVDPPVLQERQPVGQEPRPDHQHPLVAQRPQPPAELEQASRVVRREAELEHRDVRVGVHHPQRHPCAVVEATAGVLVHRLGVGHRRSDPPGQRAGIRRRVRHPVEALLEPAEVVDQRRAGTRGRQAERSRLPVRARRSGSRSGAAGRWPAPRAGRSRAGRPAAAGRRARCRARASAGRSSRVGGGGGCGGSHRGHHTLTRCMKRQVFR